MREGDILYLVAWEGWEPSYNSWEPESGISDDLIEDYEKRADEAEDEADDEVIAVAEELAAAEVATSTASEAIGEAVEHMEVEEVPTTSNQEVS